MKYLKYILVLAGVAVIALAVIVAIFRQGPRVVVEPNAEYKLTTYYIVDREKRRISLTTFQTELNAGILQLRSDSKLPLKQQVNILSRLLDRVWQDEDKAATHTLFVGRLIHAFGPDNDQMSKRLAMAAYRSDQWNKKRGKPLSGHENYFVRDLANQAMIYPELKEMFARHGLEIKFSSAEKVLINSDKLPYDCLTWFSIKGE